MQDLIKLHYSCISIILKFAHLAMLLTFHPRGIMLHVGCRINNIDIFVIDTKLDLLDVALCDADNAPVT